MVLLSHNSYDILGLSFILKAKELFKKLFELGYAKERLTSSLKKFYGRYDYLIKQYEAPSHECKMNFSLTIYKYTLHRSDFAFNHDLITELDLYRYTIIPQSICDGYGMPTGEDHSS